MQSYFYTRLRVVPRSAVKKVFFFFKPKLGSLITQEKKLNHVALPPPPLISTTGKNVINLISFFSKVEFFTFSVKM